MIGGGKENREWSDRLLPENRHRHDEVRPGRYGSCGTEEDAFESFTDESFACFIESRRKMAVASHRDRFRTGEAEVDLARRFRTTDAGPLVTA